MYLRTWKWIPWRSLDCIGSKEYPKVWYLTKKFKNSWLALTFWYDDYLVFKPFTWQVFVFIWAFWWLKWSNGGLLTVFELKKLTDVSNCQCQQIIIGFSSSLNLKTSTHTYVVTLHNHCFSEVMVTLLYIGGVL